ncbi:tetratricopeptide repeat protein [Lutibaculum baratangense]|uniref:Ancillary SecYEG translocon subunit n=1 Tax=Lutibaculum baratangense AMV1 TaxID=631454 RepID=V4RBS8_9HYPH|nr:tetratricopeptide repeat protein [Lutibaculum baratangense]ESR23611.1 hypothetical protein N177_3679 [Lutibaculum baratangense AMV1]
MSDIFREVDEEVRREQYTALWKRFAPFIIAVALLIVAGVGGWRAWEWYEARRAAEAGSLYFEAVGLATQGQHEPASQAFAEIARDGGAYSALASLRHASELAAAGDRDGAVAAYDAVANDASVPRLMRGLASIRAGYLLVDSAEPLQLSERLGPYLGDDESPWRNSALEIVGLAQYRAGDYDAASSSFEQVLADPAAPPSLLQRAEMMFTLLAAGAPDAITAAEPAPEPVTPNASGVPLTPAAPGALSVPGTSGTSDPFEVPSAPSDLDERANDPAPAGDPEGEAAPEPAPLPATEETPTPQAEEALPSEPTSPEDPSAAGTNGDTQ